MLNDFSWNMTGYIPKHAVNPSDDGIPPYVAERIFQLEPEPPTVDNPRLTNFRCCTAAAHTSIHHPIKE